MTSVSEASNATINFTQPVDSTQIFGPQRDSLYIVIPITIIYSLIFIIGLFGNIFTCLVIVRNKSMHTATNYYLFSLAISDLLLLVSGMPQEIYSIWSKWPYVFGNTFCVIRGLAAETSTNASVLTITLFTIERYLAICHPFVSHKMSKLSRATKHVIWLWVVALWLALPQALQFGVKETNGVIMCLQTRVIIEHSFEISTFVFFFAPMILISVLYALIGLKLRESSLCNEQAQREFQRSVSSTHKIPRRHSQSTKRVVKMLVAVVIAFFVCWAPFHAQRLVAIYGTTENHFARSPILLHTYYFLTYTSGIFYYVSTCINPIFYHIMSNKFRDAFKNSIKGWCCGRHQDSTKQCSYKAMAFVKNPPSSGTTNNSGNSQRNKSSQNRGRSQGSTDRFLGHIRVCRASGATPRGENCNHEKGHHDNHKPRQEENQMTINDARQCAECCSNQFPLETITVIAEPITANHTNDTLNLNVNCQNHNEIKLRIKDKEQEYG